MRRLGLALAGVAILIVVLMAIAQLVLPGIAAQRLRDQLSRSGIVERVQVDAFPAIELLWHHADRVVIRMSRYHSDPGALSTTVGGVANTGTLDASAAVLDTGLLTLRDATLTKRGSEVTASATVTEANLRASLPLLDSVEPVSSSGGRLTLRGTASVLGLTAAVDVTVGARNGELVAAPEIPFGGFATVTLFSNPRIAVLGVTATPSPGGFQVSALAQTR